MYTKSIYMSHVSYAFAMSRINDSCLIWMSNVSYEWVMSHMNESCLIWMGHVTYEWVMSHTNESCHQVLILRCHDDVPYEWVMSHMNASCPIWMSHVFTISLRVYAMSLWYQIWMSHVSYECVMPHMNESCLYDVSMSLISMMYLSCVYVTHMSGVYVTHISWPYHVCMSCLIMCVCLVPSCICHVYMSLISLQSRITRVSLSGKGVSSWDVNASCLISMSHVSYQWVMSHMHEPCLIWKSDVTTMSHMDESRDYNVCIR